MSDMQKKRKFCKQLFISLEAHHANVCEKFIYILLWRQKARKVEVWIKDPYLIFVGKGRA